MSGLLLTLAYLSVLAPLPSGASSAGPTGAPTAAPTLLATTGLRVDILLNIPKTEEGLSSAMVLPALVGLLAGADPYTDIKALSTTDDRRRLVAHQTAPQFSPAHGMASASPSLDDPQSNYMYSAAAAQAGGVDRGLSSSQGWLLSFNLVVASLSSLGFATADEFSVRKNTVAY